jgi:hypothetical protein
MVTGDPCAQAHVRLELGAYLLGAIEPAQRALVNRHLRTCLACRAELSDLASLPSLLRRVPGDAVGQLLDNDPPRGAPAPPLSTPAAAAAAWAVTVQGTSPVTGAWAAVRYADRPWGTELQVSVAGIAPGTRCRLLVIGTAGQKVAAGGWDLAASQQPAWYPASVPLRAASLRSFEIITGRTVLVTIPAR